MLLALQNVVTGFLRRTWLVALVALLACGSFAARAVAALQEGPGVDEAVAAPVTAVVQPPPRAPAVSRRGTPASADAFVARNIFCSACEPSKGGPVSTSYAGHPAVLIATSIGSDPRATLRVIPTEVQGSWTLGEEIPGVGKLQDIHPTSIEVADAAGHTKRISLLGEGADAATSDAPPPPGAGGGEAPSTFADRVRKIDDTTFEVDRSLIRELVMSASKPGMGGATPMMKNGVITGIRLFGITKTSPGAAIELRTGDVITEIDGQPLQHVQMLLDLFARLETVSAVELGGTRGGKPLKRSLRLR